MSFSKDIETIKYNYGNQSSIFEVGKQYGVALKISDFWTKGNKLFFETGLSDLLKGTFSLEFFDNQTIRFKYYRYGAENRYEEHLNKLKPGKFIHTENETSYIIKFNSYTIKITKKGFDFQIIDSKEKKVLSLYKRLGYKFFESFLAPPLGFKLVKHHIAYPFISFDLENDENIYGLGEKYKSFERRGIKAEMISQSTNIVNTTDISYASIPLVYSTRGYGILVNSGFKSHFEVGSYATDALTIMSEEPCLDLFIFLGSDLKSLIKKYTELTGKVTNYPDRGYGVIVSRLYYNNSEEALTEIKNAKDNNFPIDIVGIDPKWLKLRYTKSCNFTFNDEAFKSAKFFSDQARKYGVETSFWINTNVQGDDSEYFKNVFEKGYLVKDKDGKLLPAEIGPALVQQPTYAIDFTNRDAYDFYKNQIHNLIDNGIRYFTVDYGGGVPRNAVMANGRSGREMKNFSQWLYPKAVFEAMEEKLGKGNALLYRRPGFIGGQRYGGKWGGDSFTRFQELQNQIRAGLSLSLTGEFMWGMDMGGGYRGKPNEELILRWNQAGALMTFTRFHGIGKREPWHTSKKATENAKKYLLIKRMLHPYYKSLEIEAIKTGIPALRPLVVEYPTDRFVRKIEDQFLIGDKIMVAPVVDQGVIKRQIYFPGNTNWVDFETNKVYESGKVYEVEAQLEKLPFFVKDGAALPIITSSEINFDKIEDYKISLKPFGKGSSQGIYKFKLGKKEFKISYEVKNGKIV